jgi:hypothetical protein
MAVLPASEGSSGMVFDVIIAESKMMSMIVNSKSIRDIEYPKSIK